MFNSVFYVQNEIYGDKIPSFLGGRNNEKIIVGIIFGHSYEFVGLLHIMLIQRRG